MSSETSSLVNIISRTRISSVLNKDNKQFGKQHLFDGDEETCWNSDQGSPQWVMIEFKQEVIIKEIQIQFQGGFVGKVCTLEKHGDLGNNFVQFYSFHPLDTNQVQIFHLPEATTLSTLKIVFDESTDFFGRVTVYKLDFIGRPS
ncbi:unnamed protein product [Lymnaea stagnalis]|uniref:Nuclear receptor 2C2-associated protein n=1 Tax=Lymnaea stagnalis TaxID=6523 RepID=A0AAV2HER8_LYMST